MVLEDFLPQNMGYNVPVGEVSAGVSKDHTFSIFLILQGEDELNYVEEIFFIEQPLQKMGMNTE